MQPSHIGSNSTYPTEHTALQAIEDLLFNEDEQEELPFEHTQAHFLSFAELTQRPSAQTAPLSPSPDHNSIASGADLGSIQQFFYNKGIPNFANLSGKVVRRRLQKLNLSAEKLMEILNIADQPNHPTLVRLGITQLESKALITTLSDITNSPVKVSKKIRDSVEQGQNDANEIIAALIVQVRLYP